jgi:hypothetical protein
MNNTNSRKGQAILTILLGTVFALSAGVNHAAQKVWGPPTTTLANHEGSRWAHEARRAESAFDRDGDPIQVEAEKDDAALQWQRRQYSAYFHRIPLGTMSVDDQILQQ